MNFARYVWAKLTREQRSLILWAIAHRRPAFLAFGFAFVFLVLTVGFPSLIPPPTVSLPALGALFFSMIGLWLLLNIARVVKRIGEPKAFATGVVDFVKNAAKKGLKSEAANTLVIDAVTSQVFSATAKAELFSYVGDNYRQALSLLIKSIEAQTPKRTE